ncbi:hypothetical protein BDS110ZK25_16420 [Bradyrhizobium diazoefficiens]|uniref:Uncharacterized protein n=1 Tax=Bradyrhizobium diazoefficiens TaxID=1355477 RepID=A0A810D236_9BRAD|nr:hypothetical protein XF1B_69250 [Bradyrhizobium diazoefficiens]BCE50501.1 hypothetical protein XF4B_68500 [Bradyrhizobium diazoefficiens]BCE94004.1 hypothetical protein XF10B_68020 [Bradyrhizobium diazoefficiens]BCF28945.1 hypothetical protein XF14B_68970 [Bradyrhizobium diazoefficiens]
MRMSDLYQGSCVPKFTRHHSVTTSAKQEQADIARPFIEQRSPDVLNTARQQAISRDGGTVSKPDR